MQTQTNLYVQMTSGKIITLTDVHPDNRFGDIDGDCLTAETNSGDKIYYVPVSFVSHWWTQQDKVVGAE